MVRIEERRSKSSVSDGMKSPESLGRMAGRAHFGEACGLAIFPAQARLLARRQHRLRFRQEHRDRHRAVPDAQRHCGDRQARLAHARCCADARLHRAAEQLLFRAFVRRLSAEAVVQPGESRQRHAQRRTSSASSSCSCRSISVPTGKPSSSREVATAATRTGSRRTSSTSTFRSSSSPAASTAAFRTHVKAAPLFAALFAKWEAADLLHLIMSYDGCFVPRYKRGASRAAAAGRRPRHQEEHRRRRRAELSNHSFGSAFDINAP